MLTLVLALAVSQPLSPPPVVAVEAAPPEVKLNTMGRKAGFFSAPRVGTGALIGRVALTVVGAAVGGLLGSVPFSLGSLFSAISGSPVFLTVGTLIAWPLLSLGVALGAAVFGDDYGKDLADSMIVGLGTSAASLLLVILAGTVFANVFVLPVVLLASAALLPLGTPLIVQALKKPRDDGPSATVTLARF